MTLGPGKADRMRAVINKERQAVMISQSAILNRNVDFPLLAFFPKVFFLNKINIYYFKILLRGLVGWVNR